MSDLKPQLRIGTVINSQNVEDIYYKYMDWFFAFPDCFQKKVTQEDMLNYKNLPWVVDSVASGFVEAD